MLLHKLFAPVHYLLLSSAHNWLSTYSSAKPIIEELNRRKKWHSSADSKELEGNLQLLKWEDDSLIAANMFSFSVTANLMKGLNGRGFSSNDDRTNVSAKTELSGTRNIL